MSRMCCIITTFNLLLLHFSRFLMLQLYAVSSMKNSVIFCTRQYYIYFQYMISNIYTRQHCLHFVEERKNIKITFTKASQSCRFLHCKKKLDFIVIQISDSLDLQRERNENEVILQGWNFNLILALRVEQLFLFNTFFLLLVLLSWKRTSNKQEMSAVREQRWTELRCWLVNVHRHHGFCIEFHKSRLKLVSLVEMHFLSGGRLRFINEL